MSVEDAFSPDTQLIFSSSGDYYLPEPDRIKSPVVSKCRIISKLLIKSSHFGYGASFSAKARQRHKISMQTFSMPAGSGFSCQVSFRMVRHLPEIVAFRFLLDKIYQLNLCSKPEFKLGKWSLLPDCGLTVAALDLDNKDFMQTITIQGAD